MEGRGKRTAEVCVYLLNERLHVDETILVVDGDQATPRPVIDTQDRSVAVIVLHEVVGESEITSSFLGQLPVRECPVEVLFHEGVPEVVVTRLVVVSEPRNLHSRHPPEIS
jgi:hypothetical protein